MSNSHPFLCVITGIVHPCTTGSSEQLSDQAHARLIPRAEPHTLHWQRPMYSTYIPIRICTYICT